MFQPHTGWVCLGFGGLLAPRAPASSLPCPDPSSRPPSRVPTRAPSSTMPPLPPLFGRSLSLTVRCVDPWGLTNACKLLGCSRFGYGMGLGWYGMVCSGRESLVETEGQGKWAIAQPDRIVGHSRPRPFAFVTFCGPASKVWQSNVVSTPPPFWGLSKQINQMHAHTNRDKHTKYTRKQWDMLEHTQDMEMETMSVGGHLGIRVLPLTTGAQLTFETGARLGLFASGHGHVGYLNHCFRFRF